MFKCCLPLILALLASPVQAAVDPTLPPVALRNDASETTASLEPLSLQGVLGGRTPRALINGVSVPVGQKVAGARVISIRSSAVLVERQGQREWLRMAPTILQLSR